MAEIIGTGISEEELRRLQREAEEQARREAEAAEKRAAEEAEKAQEEARAEQEAAQATAEEAAEQAREGARVSQGPTNRPFTPEQSFLLAQRKAVRETETDIVKVGELDALPAELEPHREMLEERNRKGQIIPSAVNNWGTNRINIDFDSIKDIDQAVYFATTLATDSDKTKFFKEYASRTGQSYEAALAYADGKLGTKIFSTPQSNAGKRNAMTDALEKIGLFDINGEDIKIGTADFDTVVQSLANIADEDTAKKAAGYVESLTKIPGSPYYGMTFNKDEVAYRDSANLPAKVYKEEKEALSGLFYSGDGADETNLEAYLATYEEYLEIYGEDKYAFRQMERALKDAYEKQTGYVAPDSAKVQEAIKQIQGERALLSAAEAEEAKKGFWSTVGGIFKNLFTNEKKEEEEEFGPAEPTLEEGEDYSMRDGYAASAGASPTMPPQATGTESEEAPAEVQGPVYQPQAPAEVQGPAYQPQESVQTQEPMSYMDAMRAYSAGLDLSEENMALIADSIGNDDFRNYVLNNAHPGAQAIMKERTYGGTMLTTEQAISRANTITSGRQLLGSTLGGAVEALETGAFTGDVTGAGYQLMADVMNDVSRYIRSGRIAVPAGENKYDYVINNVPHIKQKAEQLAGLQKEVNAITTARAIEAAQEYDKKVDDAEQRFLSGHATQEDLMLLSQNVDPDSVDLNADQKRMQFRAQLSHRSMWYDDDGAFWNGGSAAADEGLRLRQTHADGLYGDYKRALLGKAHDVIDELTYIAADHNMTLGAWMEKVGLPANDPSAIMDMAYNRMCAEGAALEKDPEAQEAVNTLAGVETQSVGWLGAGVLGLGHGLADDTYHFMNAGYLMYDAATYDMRRNEVIRKWDGEYGALGPKVYRAALTAYANSGELSKEQSQELLEDIARCTNIYDIPVDFDPGLIEGLYLDTMNGLSKVMVELESVRELLPEGEARIWDALYGVGTNVPGMIRSAATKIGAAAVGVPLPAAKAAGLWMGYGATTFSRGTKKYEDAGMTRSAAMSMGMLEAGAMMAVNLVGQDTVTSYLTGKALTREGIETAFRDERWFGVAKAIAKKAAPLVAGEATEEGEERLAEEAVSLAAPVVEALERGEQMSLSKGMQMTWAAYKDIDVKNLMGEVMASGLGGAVYGALFAFPKLATTTMRSRANARTQALYPSVDIASQIVHGEIETSDENMGRFIVLMREDLEKPEFRALLDKRNDSAEQANSMAVAAILGEGKEFKDKAVKLNQTADQYDQKAEAAEKSVEINRSQFYTARKLAAEGNEGAAKTLEGFRAAWAKAQTTATENRQAAQKKREEAAEQTGRWIYACRKLGDNMYKVSKQHAGNILLSKAEEAKADEAEKKLAEEEANIDAMGAEAFIEKNYPNASDEQKDHIREIYGVPVGAKKETAATQAAGAVVQNTEDQTATEAEPTVAAETVTETAQSAPVAQGAAPAQAAETPVQTATAPQEMPTMQTQTSTQRTAANLKRQLDNATKFAGQVTRRFGVATEIVSPEHEKLKLKSGRSAAAAYDRETDTIYVSANATQGDVFRAKVMHELAHRTEGTEAYAEFAKAIKAAYFKGSKENEESFRRNISRLYASSGVKLSKDGLEHEVVSRITEEIIGGNEEIVNRLVADSPSVARKIMDAIKSVLSKLTGAKGEEVDQMRAVEEMFRKALDEAQTQKREFDTDGIQYSLREKEPPKNVVYAYKAFYARDGKLYPPMVANITDEADKQKVSKATSGTMKSLPTPVGVWLDADIGGIMVDKQTGEPVRTEETGRLRVKNDKSSGDSLAFRPGWHLGEWPDAKQFNKGKLVPYINYEGKQKSRRMLMPDDLVFAKCEVSADVDYQLDALSYGISEKGSFSRSQAGLPFVPDDGFYKYRTNVDPTTAPWLIAGSIKVVEILDDDDCARVCAEFGVTPDKRESGEKIDLAKYGLKRGPVDTSTEGMERFKENDANRANKALLERSLNDPNYADAYVQRDINFDDPKQYKELQKEFAMNGQDIEAYRKKYETEGFASSGRAKTETVSKETGEPLTGTVKGDTVVQYSLDSWTPEEQQTVRTNLIGKGYDEDAVDNWIDDVNSVAAIVAADRDRLDFEAADNQVMLKPNQEYVRTLDASTLCAKRLIYQGTFNAIQHRMPNKVMTSDDLIRLRNMMAEAGYETPCGICYVESRRRNLGTFAKKWLNGYDAKDGYQPKLDDVTTTDGLERMRREHPEVYESFTNEMKRKGSNNPKVVQLRTDYRGDIRKLSDNDIDKIVKIGGLRVQSFSDFETPHLLDMMQAVLDMTEKGLTSQAYTKVPNFAWVFGDTGIKINLSLIAEGNGLDENGNLIFSSYEGMDFEEAMRLRDRYSKNVGTILVGLNDAHIKAAMADPRIDFIIPFHKSGWGKRQLAQLSGMSGYMDYTRDQNERRVVGTTKTGKPKTKNVVENFHPVGPDGYWDFDKSGDENAVTYLRMCEEDGRIPKFNRFLAKDEDGHYVAPSGYWKLLIDFKMYDNDGAGAPQMPVHPSFNMVEARRVLGEYEGGADTLPVARDIVERFVSQPSGESDVQYAIELDESNWPIVKADRNFVLSNNRKEWSKQIRDYIRKEIRDKGIVSIKTLDGDTITLDSNSREKARDWLTDGDETDNRVRKNAFAHLDEVVAVSEDVSPGEPNSADGKSLHGWAKDGWRYREAVFEDYSGKRYLLTLSVGIDADQQTMYNIGKVEEIKTRTDTPVSGQQGRVPSGRAETDESPALRRYRPSTDIIPEGESVGNMEFSLPDDDFLRAEIDAWKRDTSYSVDSVSPAADTGDRQYATRTIQQNEYVPDWIKQEFLNDPTKREYSRESNMAQLERAWGRIQREGYDAVRDRLVNRETKYDSEDNADALVMMRTALHENDMDTFMAIATKYNAEGTDQAKALQIRSMMRRMTPTGFSQKVIQNSNRKLQERMKKRPLEHRRIEKESGEIIQKRGLKEKDSTSTADKLARGESIRIDNKFGAPLNDVKRELVKEFGLEKTTRPGVFYNWATTKQRMLEDILTTDDVWAKDSNGMNLVDRLSHMKHGYPVVTKADVAYITEQMGIFERQSDKNSREADVALSRAYEAEGNILEATGREKRRAWRYTSMLLSVASATRNFIGNVAQSIPNSVAGGIAVEMDRIISAVTGTERTRAHLSVGDRVNGWNEFLKETKNTFRDFFVDKTVTQRGEDRYNRSQRGRVYQTQAFETLRQMEGLLMSVGDRNFWKKRFFNSLAEQQRLAEINGTEFDIEAAMETAEAEANYATFNEDGIVRRAMSMLTQAIPPLDYLMPFVGVPTNIIKRQIEFSPIGFATTAAKHGMAALRGEEFDQRAFVDGMSRSLTGTGMMLAGMALASMGAIKLGTKEEDDDKSYGVRTALGDQYGVYFTIGDKNYSITTFSPAASALVAGAFVVDALGDNQRWYQALWNGMTKNVNEIFDASYMSALGDALNTSNGKTFVENLGPAIGSAVISQNIPAPIGHWASSMDEYVRDTKDKDALMEIVKTTLNKIPGARELLPEKVDIAGRAVRNTKQGLAAFVDPFTTSYVEDDPALSEMIRLRDVLTEAGDSEPRAHMATDALSGRKNTLTQNKVSYTVTAEEKEAYRKRYGDLWRNGGVTYNKNGKKKKVQGVEELISSRYYQLLDTKEQAKAIQEIITAAKTGATYEIMNHK